MKLLNWNERLSTFGREGSNVVALATKLWRRSILNQHQPDIAIIMNPIYKAEIVGMIDDMGIEASLSAE